MNTGTNSEKIRAAIIAFVQSFIPVLILLDVVSWTSDDIAKVMLVVTNAVTLVFLLWPNKVEA